MKIVRILAKTCFFIFLILTAVIFSLIIYLQDNVSNDYKIKRGETLNIESVLPITAVYNGTKISQISTKKSAGEKFSVELKAFGIIPFSKVDVEVVDELYVSVLGTPFGMKIYTKGVYVSELTEVVTSNGNVNPAKKAGIKKGDYIVSVNGQKIYTNEDLSKLVENSNGQKMKFEIIRRDKKIYFTFSPVKSVETDSYKIGIWIKDSSAGIGTLTFYSPSNNIVCGLGHGVCEEDSSEVLQLNSGEIVSAEIIDVEKGSAGGPGQLKGRFTNTSLGSIDLNCEKGIYSLFKGEFTLNKLTEIAFKQEVKDGSAQIFCTINGTQPKLYSCEIKVRTASYLSATQNLLVTVTDKELLEKTGGIVQGMSGSPLLQNGKLIGAVTHVLVDDPTKGYAIFAENMLETAQGVAEDNKLKDAS